MHIDRRERPLAGNAIDDVVAAGHFVVASDQDNTVGHEATRLGGSGVFASAQGLYVRLRGLHTCVGRGCHCSIVLPNPINNAAQGTQ